MKLALTVWENRISPVADSARQLMIVTLDRGVIGHRRFENFDAGNLFEKADRLAALGIEVFICGAISSFLASLVQGYNVQLIPFIRGDVDDVLNACATDSLCSREFIMSGCRPDFQSTGNLKFCHEAPRRNRFRNSQKKGLIRSNRQKNSGGPKT